MEVYPQSFEIVKLVLNRKTTEQASQPESVVVPSHVNLVSVG